MVERRRDTFGQSKKREPSKLQKHKGISVGIVLGVAASGGLLAACGNAEPVGEKQAPHTSSKTSGSELKSFFAHMEGRGYTVLKDDEATSLGIEPVTPSHELNFTTAKTLYINNDKPQGAKDERWTQWVFPKSYANAGETSHYELNETGDPATVIVPKGIKVREVAYVDTIKNQDETQFMQTYDTVNKDSLGGPQNKTRVFYGVDRIILDLPQK